MSSVISFTAIGSALVAVRMALLYSSTTASTMSSAAYSRDIVYKPVENVQNDAIPVSQMRISVYILGTAMISDIGIKTGCAGEYSVNFLVGHPCLESLR